MIHAYHLIWGTYGFWLPNDPRGSWSEFIGSWELARFGKASHAVERLSVDAQRWSRWREAATTMLQFPAVALDDAQIQSVADGFASAVCKGQLTVWACSILPDHVHMVVARHRYKVEHICNLFKGEATRSLTAASLHPLAAFRSASGKLPHMWSRGHWKGYLDSDDSIEAAIRYVDENPVKEGNEQQSWSFVTPFDGLPKSGWTTYY